MELAYERSQDEMIMRTALLKLWSRLLLMLKSVWVFAPCFTL